MSGGLLVLRQRERARECGCLPKLGKYFAPPGEPVLGFEAPSSMAALLLDREWVVIRAAPLRWSVSALPYSGTIAVFAGSMWARKRSQRLGPRV
jgi:hypothetical protein